MNSSAPPATSSPDYNAQRPSITQPSPGSRFVTDPQHRPAYPLCPRIMTSTTSGLRHRQQCPVSSSLYLQADHNTLCSQPQHSSSSPRPPSSTDATPTRRRSTQTLPASRPRIATAGRSVPRGTRCPALRLSRRLVDRTDSRSLKAVGSSRRRATRRMQVSPCADNDCRHDHRLVTGGAYRLRRSQPWPTTMRTAPVADWSGRRATVVHKLLQGPASRSDAKGLLCTHRKIGNVVQRA